ncbi:hypothetical protein GGX14DRAFT_698997 [Mycena pura]|uniref:Uncharacterized protein n=1 Tax=Mycena pura TaxID=153505 RepID=A0AAD6V688_9AGAR|nr:hypothetical protein GGX14DRAFT_698997 [Mycena pura]
MPPIPAIQLVVERARYLPPRNPIDSERGIVDATTLILLQKMMADSYEHGRVVWRENRARCAITGEPESKDLPCGPNPAQKKVEAWLVSAGLLDADEDSDEEEDDEMHSSLPSTPDPPSRRAWHRRPQIVITRNASSASAPALQSPRSPLSPARIWSAVQRSTTSLPLPTLRFKPVPVASASAPPSPSPPATPQKKCRARASTSAPPHAKKPPVRSFSHCQRSPPNLPRPSQSADPSDSVLATAFKRAAQLRTITADDVDSILRHHRLPRPPTRPDASWYISPIASAPVPVPVLPPRPPARRPASPEAPASYRWPAPVPPTRVPAPKSARRGAQAPACPDVRWYHPLLLAFLWHILIVSFSAFVLLRLIRKPLVCLVVLYYAVLLLDVLTSLL